MEKMNCKCGYLLSTTQTPNDIQLRVYTDKEWDVILNCDSIEPWKLPLPKYDVWKCPNFAGRCPQRLICSARN